MMKELTFLGERFKISQKSHFLEEQWALFMKHISVCVNHSVLNKRSCFTNNAYK